MVRMMTLYVFLLSNKVGDESHIVLMTCDMRQSFANGKGFVFSNGGDVPEVWL